MSTIRNLKGRPWLTTAMAGGLAALAMLVIPISYQRVTGHRVAVTLGGPNLEMEQLAGVAQQMKALLGVEQVRVEGRDAGGAPSFEMSAEVAPDAGRRAEAIAKGFAHELAALGYVASARTEPIREQVSGNVYAFARDQVIRIQADGKSPAQLETEIRQKLAEAGVTNAQVSVTGEKSDGKEKLQVKIEAQQQSTDPGTQGEEVAMPKLVLQKNGAPLEGKGFSVQARKMKSPDGAVSLTLEVTQDSRQAVATVAGIQAKSDAAIQSEVEAQLRQAGLDVIVTVTAGSVEVKSRTE